MSSQQPECASLCTKIPTKQDVTNHGCLLLIPKWHPLRLTHSIHLTTTHPLASRNPSAFLLPAFPSPSTSNPAQVLMVTPPKQIIYIPLSPLLLSAFTSMPSKNDSHNESFETAKQIILNIPLTPPERFLLLSWLLCLLLVASTENPSLFAFCKAAPSVSTMAPSVNCVRKGPAVLPTAGSAAVQPVPP